MKPEDQRVALCEAMGYQPCFDRKCDYREVPHLHKEGAVYFPETYSIPMYPDPLTDLNACHAAEEILDSTQALIYAEVLAGMIKDQETVQPWFEIIAKVIHATAAQRTEALLRTLGLWKE